MALKPRSTFPLPMISVTSYYLSVTEQEIQTHKPYARVIGLQKSHLDALILEVPLGLGQVQRCMVGGSMPATQAGQPT